MSVILPPVDKSRAFVCVMPHRFRDLTPQSIMRLLEIIELEKPAHTTYMLKFEEPPQSVEEREYFQIGVRSGIAVGDEVVTPLAINEDTGEPDYPIEKVERSLVIVATTIHRLPARELLEEGQLDRFLTFSPQLDPNATKPLPEP